MPTIEKILLKGGTSSKDFTLHDIGMTPEYKKVENLHNILLKKEHNLTLQKKEEFQKWLDEEGALVDLDGDKIDDENKIEELITFYCRHKQLQRSF